MGIVKVFDPFFATVAVGFIAVFGEHVVDFMHCEGFVDVDIVDHFEGLELGLEFIEFGDY
ncbi:MAG: hypothetical protein JST19_10970 [Bacteroidetes bacterium]|nr:hypothetical protein [Bacteroidota bacterium]